MPHPKREEIEERHRENREAARTAVAHERMIQGEHETPERTEGGDEDPASGSDEPIVRTLGIAAETDGET